MRTSAILMQKLRIFQYLWSVRTDKGEEGLSQCGQGGDQFFAILCERLLHGPLLSTNDVHSIIILISVASYL